MKRFKYLMVACLLGIASTASAQFVNTNSSSMSNGSSNTDAWQGVRVSYHPVSIDYYIDSELNGLSIGYAKSFGISKNAPVFIETGANVSWFGGKLGYEPEDWEEMKLNVISVNVPINLGYKFDFSENWGLFPYVGLTLRGNVIGKVKTEDGSDTNIFDSEGSGKRFQIGWQIGIGVNFNKFYISASYGTDFNEFIKGTGVVENEYGDIIFREDIKSKITMPSITIGFNM